MRFNFLISITLFMCLLFCYTPVQANHSFDRIVQAQDTFNITCPGIITHITNCLEFPSLFGFEDIVYSGGCLPYTTAGIVYDTFDIICKGTFKVDKIFSAIDACGDTAKCSVRINVYDTTKPIAKCNPLTIYLNSSGTYRLSKADLKNLSLGSYDDCSEPLQISSGSSVFSCSHIGFKIIGVTVKDNCGNASSCKSLVTIKDTLGPKITCPANITAFVDQNNCSKEITYAVTAIDNCMGPVTITYLVPTTHTYYPGTVTLTVTARDQYNNAKTCSFKVTVKDTIKPTVVCRFIGDTIVTNTCSKVPNPFLVTSDNCSGIVLLSYSPNINTPVPPGNYTYTVTATDSFGNTSTCKMDYSLIEIVPPTISCKSTKIKLDTASTYNIKISNVLNTATDNCILGEKTFFPTSVSCANNNTVSILVTVKDVYGNMSTCNGTIKIISRLACGAQMLDEEISDANPNDKNMDDNRTYDQNKTALTVSPNPVTDRIEIRLSDVKSAEEIWIRNSVGQQMYYSSSSLLENAFSIPLHETAINQNGLYFIVVKTAEGYIQGKVVVVKN